MVVSSTQPLAGFSIGLSGAVPERKHWTEPAMDRAILEFVASFSATVLQKGGRLVHGSHPAFTPVIARQARLHGRQGERQLALVVSELWPATLEDYRRLGLTAWVDIISCPKVGAGDEKDAQTRNASLSAMRRRLIEELDLIVAVGGKLHDATPFNPGITEELELAAKASIPALIVGSHGGMAAQAANNPLQGRGVIDIINTTDISHCVYQVYKTILGHLQPDPDTD